MVNSLGGSCHPMSQGDQAPNMDTGTVLSSIMGQGELTCTRGSRSAYHSIHLSHVPEGTLPRCWLYSSASKQLPIASATVWESSTAAKETSTLAGLFAHTKTMRS
jgi:hypothetical protein